MYCLSFKLLLLNVWSNKIYADPACPTVVLLDASCIKVLDMRCLFALHLYLSRINARICTMKFRISVKCPSSCIFQQTLTCVSLSIDQFGQELVI